jgi:hypothetical protein
VTFSDSRVVDLVKSSFVAVWESVSPVSTVTFDLGDGKSVRGIQSGEIALYFCRPDGKVFDILPALHSPHVTYWAIQNALDFYRQTGATDEAIREDHRAKLSVTEAFGGGVRLDAASRRARAALRSRRAAGDPGTRALGEMSFSKLVMANPEPIVVVEPGGLEMFKRGVHEALSVLSPRTPSEWKEHVFEKVLDQPLGGGEVTYGVNTVVPMAVLEE